jgi:hypothetical protein
MRGTYVQIYLCTSVYDKVAVLHSEGEVRNI